MVFLNILWKRKKVILGITIALCLLGLIFSVMVGPSYKTTVEIAIQPTDMFSNFEQDPAAIREYFRHQIEIIKSDAVIDDVIDKLHLGITDLLDQRKPRESLLKHIKVEIIGSSIVKITSRAKTPQLAAAIASQAAKSYMDQNKEKSFAISQEAMEWFTQTHSLGKELKETEYKLLKFIEDNKMQNPEESLAYYQEIAEGLMKRQAQLGIDLREDRVLLEKLQDIASKDIEDIIAQPLDDPLKMLMGDYRQDYVTTQTAIEKLMQTYKPDHPKLVELNERKKTIIENINNTIKEALANTAQRVNDQQVKIDQINAEIEKEKKNYTDTLDKKREYDLLEVKFENLKNLYEEAQKQLQSRDISIIKVSIVGFARKDNAPVVKVRPLNIFLVTFGSAGLLIGILMAFFLERSSMQKKPSFNQAADE